MLQESGRDSARGLPRLRSGLARGWGLLWSSGSSPELPWCWQNSFPRSRRLPVASSRSAGESLHLSTSSIIWRGWACLKSSGPGSFCLIFFPQLMSFLTRVTMSSKKKMATPLTPCFEILLATRPTSLFIGPAFHQQFRWTFCHYMVSMPFLQLPVTCFWLLPDSPQHPDYHQPSVQSSFFIKFLKILPTSTHCSVPELLLYLRDLSRQHPTPDTKLRVS